MGLACPCVSGPPPGEARRPRATGAIGDLGHRTCIVIVYTILTALACLTRRRSNSRPRSHARWLLMVRCPRHIAPVPRTAQELWLHACQAHSPRAAGSWSCVPTAVLRASQTDLACAHARPLAGQFGAVPPPRTPTRPACRRAGIDPTRCARAQRWRMRPLSRPRPHVCPLSASQSDRVCV